MRIIIIPFNWRSPRFGSECFLKRMQQNRRIVFVFECHQQLDHVAKVSKCSVCNEWTTSLSALSGKLLQYPINGNIEFPLQKRYFVDVADVINHRPLVQATMRLHWRAFDFTADFEQVAEIWLKGIPGKNRKKNFIHSDLKQRIMFVILSSSFVICHFLFHKIIIFLRVPMTIPTEAHALMHLNWTSKIDSVIIKHLISANLVC